MPNDDRFFAGNRVVGTVIALSLAILASLYYFRTNFERNDNLNMPAVSAAFLLVLGEFFFVRALQHPEIARIIGRFLLPNFEREVERDLEAEANPHNDAIAAELNAINQQAEDLNNQEQEEEQRPPRPYSV